MALCFDVILRDIWRIWAWRRCTLAAEARDGWQASVVSGVVKAAAGASDDDVMLRAVRLSPGGLRRGVRRSNTSLEFQFSQQQCLVLHRQTMVMGESEGTARDLKLACSGATTSRACHELIAYRFLND